MPLLINNQVAEDNWVLVNEENFSATTAEKTNNIIVPLALYSENTELLSSRDGQLALQIDGDDDLTSIINELDKFPLIAINFPVLRDGRGFSIARLLLRKGYQGQIRAIGDIGRDRLEYLQRCGFNAIVIDDDQFSPEMLNAFDEMSTHYQSAADGIRAVYHQV